MLGDKNIDTADQLSSPMACDPKDHPLMKLRKEELVKMCHDLQAAPLHPSLITWMESQAKELTELRSQVESLSTQLTQQSVSCACHMTNPSDETIAGSRNQSNNNASASFADVVRNSVQSTLRDEQIKSQIIISKVDEKANATQFLTNLCEKMSFTTEKSTDIERIGRKSSDRNRLLKVSFQTPFDARSFKARFDELKRENDTDLPNIRVRPSKTKKERELFSKNSQLAHKLNEEAKRDNSAFSFSLRDDGHIWKFVQQEDGKWKKDKDFKLPVVPIVPEAPASSPLSTGSNPAESVSAPGN